MPRTNAALPRLFVEHPLGNGWAIVLDREQSNYLGAVLRKRVGDEVILFNGRDGAWRARITEPGKKAVGIELVEQTAPQTPPADLWYGFAPLKSARLDYVVQKATEMGVGTIQPVITKFTQVSRLRPEKLRANAIEAAEQCEVLSVPVIADEIALSDLVESWQRLHHDRRLIVADEMKPSGSPVDRIAEIGNNPVGLLIGPEGGFSSDERNLLLAQTFVVPISLGPRILRADTAAVAALAVVQAIIGDWR